MIKRIGLMALLALLCLALPTSALAQDYYFQLPQLTIDVFWNEDGTQSLDYTFVFANDPSGHAIEYVDLGLPNSDFDVTSISASVDGNPLTYISRSEFQGEGSDGVAVGLGAHSIPPGQTGTVRIYVGKVSSVLYADSKDPDYASAVFKNAYFVSSIIYGKTDLTVNYHLPPGVQPDEPRWHAAPAGFPDEPQTGFDNEGRIIYTWNNPNANGYTQYQFGASFPKTYIPASAIVRKDPFAWVKEIDVEVLIPFCCISFFVGSIGWGIYSENKRKLQYLPPKIKIEGHGIKRGLTAVEAAILLEEPLDKVLTMILFSVIKKNAAEVTKRDPLTLKVSEPQPESLTSYDKDFLTAMAESGANRTKALRDTIVALVGSVGEKMKGFSRKETLDYYRDITKRAWSQVEAANTPEVKSQVFDNVMEWTMLDRNYDDRTRDVFRSAPVYVPTWWGRYDPSYHSAPKVSTSSPSSPSSGPVSMPHLPGSDFAASVVNGVQTFSGKVLGDVGNFTSRVTGVTNPPPKPSTSSSGRSRGGGGGRSGGCACACACACAGCACACAGGGR